MRIHWDWTQPLILMIALGFEGGKSRKKGELNPASIFKGFRDYQPDLGITFSRQRRER